MDTNIEKTIVIISAVNFRTGGPLSILADCLSYLSKNDKLKIIAIVNDKNILPFQGDVEFIEFPMSIKFYIYRIYIEYFLFKKISKNKKPYLWLSLHDITPNVDATVRAVYCHNPAPFYKANIRDFLIEPSFFLFNKIYNIFYKINIEKNDYVIVQQQWLRSIFQKKITSRPVIVSHPDISLCNFQRDELKISKNSNYIFLYPTLPRVFKNIEIIAEATKKIISSYDNFAFDVIITISGNENRYSRLIMKSYANIANIKFIGRIPRQEVFDYYQKADCLIFPSKIETWGLPITEFKQTGKLILAADLPYAYETVGTYKNVSFFDPECPDRLASLMIDAIKGTFQCQGNTATRPSEPFAEKWDDLFDILLKKNDI